MITHTHILASHQASLQTLQIRSELLAPLTNSKIYFLSRQNYSCVSLCGTQMSTPRHASHPILVYISWIFHRQPPRSCASGGGALIIRAAPRPQSAGILSQLPRLRCGWGANRPSHVLPHPPTARHRCCPLIPKLKRGIIYDCVIRIIAITGRLKGGETGAYAAFPFRVLLI